MLVSSRRVSATPSPVGVVEVAAAQKGEVVLDRGGALLLVLVVWDMLLQRLDGDLLLGSAAASPDCGHGSFPRLRQARFNHLRDP